MGPAASAKWAGRSSSSPLLPFSATTASLFPFLPVGGQRSRVPSSRKTSARRRAIVLQIASFEWKRKIGEKVSKATSQQFEAEARDDKDLVDDDNYDNWVHATKRRKEILLEDCVKKSNLKFPGVLTHLSNEP